jgi:hypothetical protein
MLNTKKLRKEYSDTILLTLYLSIEEMLYLKQSNITSIIVQQANHVFICFYV